MPEQNSNKRTDHLGPALSDKQRERLLRKSNDITQVSNIVMLIVGMVLIVQSLIPQVKLLTGLSTVVLITTLLIFLLIGAIRSLSLKKYDLSPSDEYEKLRYLQATATAYSTLCSILLVLVFIHAYVHRLSPAGAILVAISVTKIIELRALKV